MNDKTAHRILLVCPLALFALSIITTNLQGPYYFAHNIDPDYAYLLNSLNIATLQVPGLYGHPGTTLQTLGAMVILAKWTLGWCLFGQWQSLHDAVLLHPEDYLHTINLILNVLLSGLIYIAARQIYELSGSLFAGLIFQLSFGAFMQTFLAQVRVSPEAMLAIAVVLLCLPVSRIVLGDKDAETNEWLAIATGAAVGFGIITKITFLPLASVCLLFQKKRLLGACGISCAAVALLCLVPIWTHFPDMFTWFSSLLTHTERYGTGSIGLPSVSKLWSNLLEIVRYEPMIFFFLTCYLSTYGAIRFGWIRCEGPLGARLSRLLLAGSIAIIVQAAMTIKHFALHYMLPSLVFAMLLNAALVILLSRAEPGKVGRLLYVLMLVLLGIGLWKTAPRLMLWSTKLSKQYRTDITALLQRREEMKDCTTIGYYRSSSPEFALAFGNDFVDGAYAKELARLYPKSIYYNIFAHQFYSMSLEPQRKAVLRTIAEGGCVLMQGVALSTEDPGYPAGFKLTPLAVFGDEGLYRVATDGGSVVITDPTLPTNAILVEARAFSSGNVVVDTTLFGAGISAIISPVFPAHAEYKIHAQKAGLYELRIRCASLEPRPVTVRLNGKTVTTKACSEPTDGYDPRHQAWQIAGRYELASGANVLRLERDGPFPVINSLGFVPVSK